MKESQNIFPLINHIGQLYEPFKIRFISREITGLEQDEVLIRIRASAICGSDLHIARGKHPSVPLPATLGHEFSGTVAAVGNCVEGLEIGTPVTVEPCIVCGKCEACRHGDYGYCENISYTYRMGNGAMADYIVVKKGYVYPLPPYLGFETGALIEPLSVATHAVRRAGISLGDSVVVIGDGAIGLMVAAMCIRCGAAQVIVAGHSRSRLDIAMHMGAAAAINTRELDLEEEILKLTGGKGVDKSFECVGHEDCFRQAINVLRHNGTATIAGIYENQSLTFAPARLVTHELHVQGTQGYCWDFPAAMAAAKDIPMDSFISHRFPLSRLQQALDTALDSGSSAIRVLLLPDREN